jgi:hypothetical protein
MAIEDVSAGVAGVARVPQRSAKSALISNTDNPAVQQYAQVSHFTSYLADAPPPVAENPPEKQPEPQTLEPQTTAQAFESYFGTPSSSSSSSSSSALTEPPPSVLNYTAKGTTNLLQKPSQAGQFLSLSV